MTREGLKAPELAGRLLVVPAKADINRLGNYFSKAPRQQSASAVTQLEVSGALGL